MERIAIEKLVKWNESKRRKPLIVWGARQVGKTYLIKDIFAKKHYKNNFVYVDFKIEDEINEFCSKTANAEKIIEYISLLKGQQITEKTLLIFALKPAALAKKQILDQGQKWPEPSLKQSFL